MQKVELKTHEKLEDLQLNNLQIIQSNDCYRFTSDSVLIANLVRAKQGDVVVDLGTGSGIIPILLSQKTQAKKIIGIEIQPELADMASRSVAFNNLNDKIEIRLMDLRDAYKCLGNESADVVVCNPPYEKSNQMLGKDLAVAGCNAEIFATLFDFCKCGKRLLKFGGKFYMIIKAKRMAEAMCVLSSQGLEPKDTTLVFRGSSEVADTVIIEAVKGGKVGLSVRTLTEK